jgi:hypothetical protein
MVVVHLQVLAVYILLVVMAELSSELFLAVARHPKQNNK